MTKSVFIDYANESYPHKFAGRLYVDVLVAGIPSDPRVAEGWLRSKLADKDELIRELVAKIMLERGISADEAAREAENLKHLNGFKRLPSGQVYIEGRQLKAALKEATSVGVAANKLTQRGWGQTRKFLTNFLPEHVFVVENELPIVHAGQPVTAESVRPDDGTTVLKVQQRFVHTSLGNSIQYEEYVQDAELDFTVITDHDFSDKDWAMIWTTGEQQGIGATRSQGFGRYAVTRWDRL